ncbi:MAG: 16S rRNA (adenine(1518)-N(6)/adenine(1519)-N(6))-dimethyltransferase RsmA [Hadesarchaea archaeon]|nr:16S rRNA (adenine(1518)-N(6)/adenine(1519)-N(6))-dimethyltransferase RsmA [Hadesarchaea archaeon]
MHQLLATLRRYGIRLNKRSGQAHVIDPSLLMRMVDYADISPGDLVLEIGAGIGNLTRLLAKRAGRVIAVERDAKLFRVLKDRLRDFENIELVNADILRMELPRFNKVVANLPYAISSDVTFKLLEQDFELAVLMYQREFAQRLMARPGSKDYGRLTVGVYYRAEVELLEEVKPSAFFPKPKVSSAVVRLRPRSPPFQVVDEALFFNVVRALFQHKRQKVRNALFHSFNEVFSQPRSKPERRRIVDETIPKDLANSRVMDLTPEELGSISNYIASSLGNPRAWAAPA